MGWHVTRSRSRIPAELCIRSAEARKAASGFQPSPALPAFTRANSLFMLPQMACAQGLFPPCTKTLTAGYGSPWTLKFQESIFARERDFMTFPCQTISLDEFATFHPVSKEVCGYCASQPMNIGPSSTALRLVNGAPMANAMPARKTVIGSQWQIEPGI